MNHNTGRGVLAQVIPEGADDTIQVLRTMGFDEFHSSWQAMVIDFLVTDDDPRVADVARMLSVVQERLDCQL